MEINLTQNQARVIGCMLEKEITTPDQYPLTLNALTTACNQKSSREPVMSLDEATVLDTVEELKAKRMMADVSSFGSRVAKFQHRFCNTEFGSLQFTKQELGALIVLLLRGPQTAGEIRTRTNRLCEFTDVREAEAVLAKLASEEKGPYVVKLPREPGKRDCRYMHLFSGEVDLSVYERAAQAVTYAGGNNERIAQLENDVAELKQQVAELQAVLTSLTE
ncbi:YceH family protein [Photobacterium leiognathi subsp. mandapamensis]|uniref:YceH family protein n=1 Tax=Photobacterium leiognathi TaxID=553611 RepID=UPI003AF3BA20